MDTRPRRSYSDVLALQGDWQPAQVVKALVIYTGDEVLAELAALATQEKQRRMLERVRGIIAGKQAIVETLHGAYDRDMAARADLEAKYQTASRLLVKAREADTGDIEAQRAAWRAGDALKDWELSAQGQAYRPARADLARFESLADLLESSLQRAPATPLLDAILAGKVSK